MRVWVTLILTWSVKLWGEGFTGIRAHHRCGWPWPEGSNVLKDHGCAVRRTGSGFVIFMRPMDRIGGAIWKLYSLRAQELKKTFHLLTRCVATVFKKRCYVFIMLLVHSLSISGKLIFCCRPKIWSKFQESATRFLGLYYGMAISRHGSCYIAKMEKKAGSEVWCLFQPR